MNIVKELLVRKKMTVYALAKELGVTPTGLYSMVKKQEIADGVRFGTLRKIAKATKCKLVIFFMDE